jgi:hypothetical protein
MYMRKFRGELVFLNLELITFTTKRLAEFFQFGLERVFYVFLKAHINIILRK